MGAYSGRSNYGPAIGGFTPSMQVPSIPGMPGAVNMAVNALLKTMAPNMPFFPGMSAVEQAMGTRYHQQGALAFGYGGKIMSDQSERELAQKTARLTGMSQANATNFAAGMQKYGMPVAGALINMGYGRYVDMAAESIGATQGIIGQGVFSGMRGMAGAGIMPSANAGKLAHYAAGALTPTALGMKHLGASEIGGLASSLGSRGLLRGRLEGLDDTDQLQQNVRKIQSQIKKYGSLVHGLKELFGKGKGIPQLLADLDQATQGGLAQVGPARLQQIVNMARGVQMTTGMSAAQVTGMMTAGANDARMLGLVPTIGAQTALMSAGIATEMVRNQQGGIWGGYDMGELQGMFGRRLLMGQTSGVAQLGGGLMAAVHGRARTLGLTSFDGNTKNLANLAGKMGGSKQLQSLLRNMQSGTDTAGTLDALSGGNIQNLMDELEGIGVDRSVAYSLLTKKSREAQRFASETTFAGSVMGMQDEETFRRMSTSVARPIMSAMGRDVDPTKAQELAMQAMHALTRMSNPLDARSATRQLAKGFRKAGFGDKATQMAANVYQEAMSGDNQELFMRARAQQQAGIASKAMGTLFAGEEYMLEKGGTLGGRLVEVLMAGKDRKKKFDELFGKGAATRNKGVLDAVNQMAAGVRTGDKSTIQGARANLKKALDGGSSTELMEAANTIDAEKANKEGTSVDRANITAGSVVINNTGGGGGESGATTYTRTESKDVKKDGNDGSILSEGSSRGDSISVGGSSHKGKWDKKGDVFWLE